MPFFGVGTPRHSGVGHSSDNQGWDILALGTPAIFWGGQGYCGVGTGDTLGLGNPGITPEIR